MTVPLKKSPSKSAGGETKGESKLTIDFMTISRAFLPYCQRETRVINNSTTHEQTPYCKQDLTLLSKLNRLRSLVSVALLSPWVRAPCLRQTDVRLENSEALTVRCRNKLHARVTHQALQSFGNNRGESLFSSQFRDEEHVLGSSDLVWSVCSTCLHRTELVNWKC